MAGYDSILSLAALISHHDSGFQFTPIVRDGKVISLEVQQGFQVTTTRLWRPHTLLSALCLFSFMA
jgi:hypothetical protein